MRKLITFLMTFLVGSSISYVNAESSLINFEAGYRRDHLSWKLEAPSCDPLFEISSRFRNIDIFQVGLTGKANIGCNFYGRASVYWGWILDGDYQESTKLFVSIPAISELDSIEFTTEDRNIIDGRYTVDLDIAIGYPFYFCDCTLSLAPVVGYAFDQQNFCIDSDEGVDFSTAGGFLIPVSGDDCCCRKFISRWYGPFVGVDFEYRACHCLSIFGQLEYHWAQFRGRRHFHEDSAFYFHDIHRRTWADGWVFKGGIDYDICDSWVIGLSATFKDYSGSRRHHTCEDDFSGLYGFSGSDDHLRHKNSWHSWSVQAVLGAMF